MKKTEKLNISDHLKYSTDSGSDLCESLSKRFYVWIIEVYKIGYLNISKEDLSNTLGRAFSITSKWFWLDILFLCSFFHNMYIVSSSKHNYFSVGGGQSFEKLDTVLSLHFCFYIPSSFPFEEGTFVLIFYLFLKSVKI